jgi:hypothetical protein
MAPLAKVVPSIGVSNGCPGGLLEFQEDKQLAELVGS